LKNNVIYKNKVIKRRKFSAYFIGLSTNVFHIILACFILRYISTFYFTVMLKDYLYNYSKLEKVGFRYTTRGILQA